MSNHETNIPLGSLTNLCEEFRKYNKIDPASYDKYMVKRGLRNSDGTGVIAGLSLICNVHGYLVNEGERMPIDGELIYRGINIKDIISGCQKEERFGFEETIWLLLFGRLPSKEQLKGFNEILAECRELPEYFVDDMIIKAPSPDIMNKIARSVLALYSYDDLPEDNSLENVLRQSIELIARFPTIAVSSYQVKRRHYDHESMFFHPLQKAHSTAESILSTLRHDKQFTLEEARLLDLCLILHAEHGGGNNSSFACRVLTSSGTDTFSAISAAVGSLKGPKHGGANIKVLQMLEYIKEGVKDWNDDDEIHEFLKKIMHKEAGDGSGLIYGMGHAVYTLSDPRAIILKDNARTLAQKRNMVDDFKILEAVERLTPKVFAVAKGENRLICANVDMYSGLVYEMLGIPSELYTPLFAISRIAGWCAHRIEEMTTSNRIIRPGYKSVATLQEYIPLCER
jgi:citrate synthase